ncbi:MULTISPECIES: hypothetical protein [unclassified Bradyrhizobium]
MTELDIANELLDLWEREHANDQPNYERLKKQFVVFVGEAVDDAALYRCLHEGRKSRGWPDPKPHTIEPSIEGAIMTLWSIGLRQLLMRTETVR